MLDAVFAFLRSRPGWALPALLLGPLASEPRADTPAPPSAAAPFAAEAVRAAYVINFIRFTEWPDENNATGPFVIGVAGGRALEDELIRLVEGQFIRNRRLRVLRIKSPRDAEECHVVYFGAASAPGEEAAPSADALLPALRGRPVLTISESTDFLALGGIINLYREGENLRFEIAPDAARSSGLVLSSRLLALARIVRPSSSAPRR